MLVFQNVVHRDDDVPFGVAIVKFEIAHIVFWFAAALVGFNLETVQSEAKRQRFFRYIIVILDEEMAVGSVGLEFHSAVLPREHGEQGTQQNKQDGQMQGTYRHPFPQTAFHRHDDHQYCHQCPQCHKPPCPIHVSQRIFRAM